jgi:hypothetical protein
MYRRAWSNYGCLFISTTVNLLGIYVYYIATKLKVSRLIKIIAKINRLTGVSALCKVSTTVTTYVKERFVVKIQMRLLTPFLVKTFGENTIWWYWYCRCSTHIQIHLICVHFISQESHLKSCKNVNLIKRICEICIRKINHCRKPYLRVIFKIWANKC